MALHAPVCRLCCGPATIPSGLRIRRAGCASAAWRSTMTRSEHWAAPSMPVLMEPSAVWHFQRMQACVTLHLQSVPMMPKARRLVSRGHSIEEMHMCMPQGQGGGDDAAAGGAQHAPGAHRRAAAGRACGALMAWLLSDVTNAQRFVAACVLFAFATMPCNWMQGAMKKVPAIPEQPTCSPGRCCAGTRRRVQRSA